MDQALKHKAGDRKGVALILVIGMLALMMVLGVTFSIFMRSERAAAGNFRADVQNRELLQVALGRALDAIESKVGDNVYPSWDVLTSQGASSYNNALKGAITNWVPWGAFMETQPGDLSPGWIALDVPGLGQKNIAYIVLNCSGLLDANVAGGGVRSCGTSPEEIEVKITADKIDYKNSRPFETQEELGVKGNLIGLGSPLVTYSAFPNSYTQGVDRKLVDISGSEDALADSVKKKEIIDAFIASGSSADDADFLYSQLLDYVDEDNVPQNLGTPCTERVPMINELRARAFLAEVNKAGKTCTSAIEVGVEWCYPFGKTTADSFKMVVEVVVSNVGDAASAKYVPEIPKKEYTVTCLPNTFKEETTDPYSKEVTLCSTNDVVKMAAFVGVKVLNGKGKEVDSVPYPYVQEKFLRIDFPQMKFSLPDPPEEIVGGVWQGHESIDPRYNWDTTVDAGWIPYPDADEIVVDGSMGTENLIQKKMRTDNPSEFDQFSNMHVSDEPLRNVGELSYLVRSRDVNGTPYWNTLKLWADQRQWPLDRELDHFIVGTNGTRRGLLNVNSRNVLAWEDVFNNMPKDVYPGEEGADKVTSQEAMDMAAAMTNFSGTGISLLSDFGRATNLYAAAGLGSATPLRQRSVFRNVSSLIDIRQQYYIVLLYVSTNPGNTATLKAVAEVWRDPLGASPKPKFVRMFKIINAY